MFGNLHICSSWAPPCPQAPGALDENAVPAVLVALVSKTNILDQHVMNATWVMETLKEIREDFLKLSSKNGESWKLMEIGDVYYIYML
jgi:hypothetical protein